jgi:GNAT superfamily N-acetyltransferase
LTGSIRIARFTPADYPALAAQLTSCAGDPIDPGTLAAQDAELPPHDLPSRNGDNLLTGFARRRFLAWRGNAPVGTAVAWRAPWTRPGSLASELTVPDDSPDAEGTASILLETLRTWGSELGAREIMAELDDRRTDRLATMQAGNYAIDAHIVEGRLDLEPAHVREWQDWLAGWRARPAVQVLPLSERDTPATRQQLHALYQRTLPDNPGHVDAVPDYAQWASEALETRLDWIFLALEGDEVAGVCAVVPTGEPGVAYVDYTGVDRRWRRRGVASALKAHAALTVTRDGATRLVTEWDVSNVPIARANAQFGFAVETGHYRLVARLATPDG